MGADLCIIHTHTNFTDPASLEFLMCSFIHDLFLVTSATATMLFTGLSSSFFRPADHVFSFPELHVVALTESHLLFDRITTRVGVCW